MRLIIFQKIDQLWYVAHGTALINFYMEFTGSELGAEYNPIPNLKSLSKFSFNGMTLAEQGSNGLHFRQSSFQENRGS